MKVRIKAEYYNLNKKEGFERIFETCCLEGAKDRFFQMHNQDRFSIVEIEEIKE